MTMDKQFRGDLEGTGQGQMLTAMSPVQGSAGYVAVERVTGKLQGRSGTLVLQHSGTMARGAQQLTISVVPDSGTGELVGAGGTDGHHHRGREAFVRFRVQPARSFVTSHHVTTQYNPLQAN